MGHPGPCMLLWSAFQHAFHDTPDLLVHGKGFALLCLGCISMRKHQSLHAVHCRA